MEILEFNLTCILLEAVETRASVKPLQVTGCSNILQHLFSKQSTWPITYSQQYIIATVVRLLTVNQIGNFNYLRYNICKLNVLYKITNCII